MARSATGFVAPLLAIALVGAVPAWLAAPAAAQQAMGGPAMLHGGMHVEGHIAFMQAELAITPAQQPLWDKVAAAMREDVAEMQQFVHSAPPIGETAVQRLERRAALTALRAKGEQRFLDAFRPLYASLSEAQKRAADELIARRHGPMP